MLKQDISEKRKNRHKQTQEDFTPISIVNTLLDLASEDLFSNFSKTFCDPSAGTGNIIVEVLKRRFKYCKTEEDIYKALSTIYGVELMEDNVEECKINITEECIKFSSLNNMSLDKDKIQNILNYNIVCSDFFKWDFENWKLK